MRASVRSETPLYRVTRPDCASLLYLPVKLWQNRLTRTGGLVLMLVLVFAVLAPVLTAYDPAAVYPVMRLLPPSWSHPFGTDEFGRDVFSRVVFGARTSLEVGARVVLACSYIGIMIGLVAGYFRHLDNLLMRALDGLMAFPAVLLAIAIMAALGSRTSNVVIALSFAYFPRMARVVRAQVLLVRETAYVEAATAAGTRNLSIMFRHILPNCLSPILIQASATFVYAVLTEAALSFLGVGVPPELATWGNILSEGRNVMVQAPWMTFFPGMAIMVTVLGLNLFGDGLRDVLDPRTR